MTTGLRKGLTSYGDAGFSLFLRKAFIKAMGYSDDALNRPIVGITNTYSDYNPCHGNVPQIIEAVKRGVMLTGAMPMVFPTISIAESFAHPTSMYLRNLMALDLDPKDIPDSQLKQHPLVVVGNPDEVVRKLEGIEKAGVDQVICFKQAGRIPHQKIMNSLRLMAKHVLPHFNPHKRVAVDGLHTGLAS